jgi:hypothetical protein
MEFYNKGELFAVNFCESEKKAADPIQEESLVLHFPTESGACLVEMTKEEISDFFNGGVRESFTMGKGSIILSDTFNIKINGFQFKGDKFSSGEVKRVKKVGEIIVLRVKIPYEESFHEAYPGFIRKMIDIEIKSVGQATVPQPGDGE